MNTDLTLAIETSGRTGSVAIGRNRRLISELAFSGMMRHSAELYPSIRKLLKLANAEPKDLAQIFISAGPGSFTGLRIAVTAAKMFNFALKTPIVTLDSLDIIAENALDYMSQTTVRLPRIAVVLDAKKDYYYASAYHRTADGLQKFFGTVMATAEEIIDHLKKDAKEEVFMLGEGLVFHQSKFQTPFIHFLDSQYWQPRAQNLLRSGWKKADENAFADPVSLVPIYIRKPDAVEKIEGA